MTIRIEGKPVGDGRFLMPHRDVKVTHVKTGADITDSIRAITVRIVPDDIATATLDIDVGELNIDGVTVRPNVGHLKAHETRRIHREVWKEASRRNKRKQARTHNIQANWSLSNTVFLSITFGAVCVFALSFFIDLGAFLQGFLNFIKGLLNW